PRETTGPQQAMRAGAGTAVGLATSAPPITMVASGTLAPISHASLDAALGADLDEDAAKTLRRGGPPRPQGPSVDGRPPTTDPELGDATVPHSGLRQAIELAGGPEGALGTQTQAPALETASLDALGPDLAVRHVTGRRQPMPSLETA